MHTPFAAFRDTNPVTIHAAPSGYVVFQPEALRVFFSLTFFSATNANTVHASFFASPFSDLNFRYRYQNRFALANHPNINAEESEKIVFNGNVTKSKGEKRSKKMLFGKTKSSKCEKDLR